MNLIKELRAQEQAHETLAIYHTNRALAKRILIEELLSLAMQQRSP